MAIIRFGVNVSEASGSIAGTVFSHNKGGPYVRNRRTPTNPNTARQQTVRVIFAGLAADWSNILTPAQRGTWDTYAEANTILNALGQAVKQTGLAWFLQCNARLIDAGLTRVVEAPTVPGPTALTTFTPTFTSTTAISVVYAVVLAGGECLQLWLTGPHTEGASPNFRQARLIGYSAADPASPAAFTLPRECPAGTDSIFYGTVLDTQGLIGTYSVGRDTST